MSAETGSKSGLYHHVSFLLAYPNKAAVLFENLAFAS